MNERPGLNSFDARFNQGSSEGQFFLKGKLSGFILKAVPKGYILQENPIRQVFKGYDT